MNDQEKAKWVSEFYAEVAKGGVMQYLTSNGEWDDAKYGPTSCSDPDEWRIKPDEHERLECRVGTQADEWNGNRFLHPGAILREVRPGDLTREEVVERIEDVYKLLWQGYCINKEQLRRIFLGDDQ